MPIDQVSPWRRALPAAALAAASILVLGACGDDSAGGEQGADVEDVQEGEGEGDNAIDVGDKVTVSAEVEDVLSNESFRLEGAEDWIDGDPLLVISAERSDVEEGDVVRVTGIVRDFDYTTYSEDYELGDEGAYDDFENRHFIVADKIRQNASPETG
ncbi:hypothetical protein FZ103_15850 [Streptomonospora sp. PA3]|uniref:hypothetical protein n=1 Tax=Streptomonospora sp. PA3 TaxID=2607326 RepID=UPI0012DBF628|nr:hypothetical protein [Streptomonospora sp. PA3]MUL42627.1 hypothetical protein [Streptomonospora sp. PA3]